MKENEFKSMGNFVLKAESLSDEINVVRNQQNDLKSCQFKTEKIMNRVIAQLALIDKVLTIPNTIEKIEDYDDTFAIGNRKNLELVASLLKSVNHSENSDS